MLNGYFICNTYLVHNLHIDIAYIFFSNFSVDKFQLIEVFLFFFKKNKQLKQKYVYLYIVKIS